jgi:hypothetical protein
LLIARIGRARVDGHGRTISVARGKLHGCGWRRHLSSHREGGENGGYLPEDVYLETAGPSTVDDVKVEVGPSAAALRAARTRLERVGAVDEPLWQWPGELGEQFPLGCDDGGTHAGDDELPECLVCVPADVGADLVATELRLDSGGAHHHTSLLNRWDKLVAAGPLRRLDDLVVDANVRLSGSSASGESGRTASSCVAPFDTRG